MNAREKHFQDSLARLSQRYDAEQACELAESETRTAERRGRLGLAPGPDIDAPRQGYSENEYLEALNAERHPALLPRKRVKEANAVLSHCQADLALPERLSLHCFAESYKSRTAGWYERKHAEIWLNEALFQGAPSELCETIAHECRHAWQAANWPDDMYLDHAAAEADAAAYAREFVRTHRTYSDGRGGFYLARFSR